MELDETRRRTGGRSARVADAVLGAAAQLVAERGNSHFSIAEVAARSGVHHASIYRRWKSSENIVLALATARLESISPIPDSGVLRADLLTYAHGMAASIEGEDGLTFLKAAIATADRDEETGTTPLLERAGQIQEMLDRAATRGEVRLHFTDVLDGILAPIYFRRIFNAGPIDDAYLERLVTRTIATGISGDQ